MNPIDENLVQQCVDGELHEEDQQALLQTCESFQDGSGWRQLALGYVEKDLFEQVFRDAVVHEQGQALLIPSTTEKSADRLSMWLTMVSALTLGVCATLLGQHFITQNIQPTDDNQGGMVASDPVLQPIETPSNTEIVAPLDDRAVNVSLPNANMPTQQASVLISNKNGQTARLPLLSLDEFRHSPEYQQGGLFPEAMKKELEARGFVVERKPRWYQVPLEDGRHVYFPAETVNVRHAIQ